MSKQLFFALIISLNINIFSCNSSDDETNDPVITDISVSSSRSFITWTDSSDLTQKLNNALSYNYASAQIYEVEKKLIFPSDSSFVNATINFKEAYQDAYIDVNLTNNSVIIDLEKEVSNETAVVLSADGPGDTYELITSVLAPGYNPIEVPDCNHPAFGRHIDEIYDNDLNANVFRFFIHVTPDDDRCINFDRQRNEIKTYGQSPDNLLGIENETVVYKWKFKLEDGFQSSSSYTHIHQLKSVGGPYASMPIYTLTTRKSSPDRLELRYAETDSQITLTHTDLAPFIGTWLEVTETIEYATSGTYDIEIKKVSDATVLLSYSNSSIVNWRPEASYVRPKWGIYRSLQYPEDLRDENVLFTDFSIMEVE